jgi:zinc transporter
MSTDPPSGLLHAYLLDGNGGATKLDWAKVGAWRPDDGVLWMNLDYSSPDSERWLADSDIPPLVRDGLLDIDPRPRALAHGDHLQLIVRGINLNIGAAPEDMVSVRAWVGPRRVITMRRRMVRTTKTIAADLELGTGPRDAGEFVTLLLDRLLEQVVLRVDTLGDEIAACEDQVVTGKRGELRTLLADHRRRAIALRRFLAPQREALAKLSAVGMPWLDASHRARIVETADRMTRTIEELDAARDRAAVTQEELQSRLAEQTNQRLYVLSLITVIFVPFAFVTSLLGVNLGVPFTGESWAFWALCGAFGVVVAIELWVLRKRGWL